MRTPEEVVMFCKKRMRQLGLGQVETLKKAGLSSSIFAMSIKRNLYMSIESMIVLAKFLEVSVGEMLENSEPGIPDDIQQMVNMLKDISPENRKIISMNIENYFKVERQDKKKQ